MLKSYTEELSNVMNQAQNVKKDLIQLMDDALSLSETLVDEIDTKWESEKNKNHSADIDLEINDNEPELQYTDKVVKFNPGNNNRIRVYDMAREFHISSRELVNMLQDSGLKITSHMNLIDADQVRTLINNIICPSEDRDLLSVSEPDSTSKDTDLAIGLQTANPYTAVPSLYEKGYPVWKIAKMLGRGQGEINLILNLSRKKTGIV